jgi:2-oxoglutarate ferredoxin oxidoreductase subunit beta
VTFNDFSSSTKSWDWAREHEEPLQEVGFVRRLPEIEVEQREGETTRVRLHDGSWITLRALSHTEHKVTERASATRLLLESQDRNELLTGLIYVNPDRPDFVTQQSLCETPLALLPDETLRPSREVLESIMASV